ncbi:MAG: CHAT domain-containing protein, partial [Rhodospirillales bacterium]|nr:CHAT domain-containing protein [Rhodospirillales bacterium]
LDGSGRWLERLRADPSPLVIDFRGSAEFLEAPWDLLADETGPLAGRLDCRFLAVRRLAPAGQPLPSSPKRLAVLFMAAAPRGQNSLEYEREEAAILREAGSRPGLDLAVEESGELSELQGRLALEGGADVVHLTGHGTGDPHPALILEDRLGNPQPARAADLVRVLAGSCQPRLLFVSACHSARAPGLMGSLAADLVRGGLPAVIGWSGAVLDSEATRFAAETYERLANHGALEDAVAWARHDALHPSRSGVEPARDWHLARLYLGSRGGGVLCSGRERRRSPEAGIAAFLDAGRRVPVAKRAEFVGRRRDLKTILRAIAEPHRQQCLGVVIHGMGNLGKSSLAARVANRLSGEYVAAVIYGPCAAEAVLQAIADATGISQAVAERAVRHRALVAGNPEGLRGALHDILCAGTEKSLLLVLDDFEQCLDDPADQNGLHRLKPGLAESFAAILHAFKAADSDSALLITSRFRFDFRHQGLDAETCLLDLPLASFGVEEREKQDRSHIAQRVVHDIA